MYDYEHILEFDKIKEQWASFAVTKAARERIAAVKPFLAESELRRELRETTEARTLLDKYGNPPLVSLSGVENMTAAAERGECLGAGELEAFAGMLTAVRRLKTYLARCRELALSLPYYEENLDPQTELEEEISMQVVSGAVCDNASRLLRSLRGEIERAEQSMREKADSVLRANRDCMSDSFSTKRGGHICVPVKKEYRFRIPGNVVDKSSTGNTVFVEPAAAAKYYEELAMLRLNEEQEVRRILYALTARVAEIADITAENIRTMEKLDFIFSRGRLSREYGGIEPEINLDGRILIEDGRHPLMARQICVPLQFSIGGSRPGAAPVRGIVITGPNTGGKTVAVKTVALTCLMAQCGLHVACRRAELCMRSNYLCDIGDGQSLSENLSTFSAHITNVLNILKQLTPDSLVILDELGSGTDPAEGMGLAIAILEELRKSGALFVVTTHYPEVKQYAARGEGIRNARMTFDRESLRPTYRLVIGEAGESCAFYIAERLGMPSGMLRTAARAAYGGQAAEWEKDGAAEEEQESSILKQQAPKFQRQKRSTAGKQLAEKFHLGDSVMLYPDKKLAIVCEPVNEKGVLRVQLRDKKIWINHKRVKLVVAAEKLYPPDYDFSIVFDSAENRKLRHDMGRKYMEGAELRTEE